MSRSSSREHGAAMVEFALLASLLIAIALGIVDFAAIYNDQIALQQGARDAARTVVKGKGDTSAYDADCSLTGEFLTAESRVKRVACLAKDRVGLDPVDVRVAIRVEDGTHAAGRALTVCIAYPARSLTGLYSKILDDQEVVSRTYTEMRVETLYTPHAPLLVDTSEDFPYGTAATRVEDWIWCTADTTDPDNA